MSLVKEKQNVILSAYVNAVRTERHVSIPVKLSKLGAKNFKKFTGTRKLFKMHEKLFGGTEFQNRSKKRQKHLLNLGNLEKDCFWTKHFRLALFSVQRVSKLRRKKWSIAYYHQFHRKICNKKETKEKGCNWLLKDACDWSNMDEF